MKRTLTILFAFCLVQLTEAQSFIQEFGKYSREDFDLKQYDKDPSAEAVVIYDIGKSYFHLTDYDGFELIFERRTKIKIFTKAGLKWAQLSIPYYNEGSRKELIEELIGNTYNLEKGTVRKTPLDVKKTYDEKFTDHWYDRKFAMPDVKEGSVIEVSYKITSPYLFNLRNWEFQTKIPTIYSVYTTKMVPFYEYSYVLQGAGKFDEYQSYVDEGIAGRLNGKEYKDMVYEFVMKDVSAFKDESFITSSNDYIIKIDFQLSSVHRTDGFTQTYMTTWPKLSEQMMDHDSFGAYLRSCKRKGGDIIDTMKLSTLPLIEKAKRIERFMKSNFNWNGISDKFSTRSVKDFLKKKTGNAADINLFLIGMLNSAGIEANPVLLSTRAHGKIKVDYPFHHFFNYVIAEAKIDGSIFLLDATEPFSAFNEIPTRCFNDKGFVVQKSKVEWLDLKSQSSSVSEYDFDLCLNSNNDSIYEKCRFVATGYNAVDYREKFKSSYKDLKAEMISANSFSKDSLKIANLYQIDKPFVISYDSKHSTEKVEDKIIVSPFCDKTMTENPLKQSSRSYPVDMVYRSAKKYQSTIRIPSGYKVLVKPENINIDNKLVKIFFTTDVQNDEIKINGYYEFKNDIYFSSDYVDIKGYFNRIVDKFNEKLVLVKI